MDAFGVKLRKDEVRQPDFRLSQEQLEALSMRGEPRPADLERFRADISQLGGWKVMRIVGIEPNQARFFVEAFPSKDDTVVPADSPKIARMRLTREQLQGWIFLNGNQLFRQIALRQ